MRPLSIVLLSFAAVLGAGCDIQPAPKNQPPSTAPSAPPPEAPKFVAPTPPALPEQPKVETTNECIDVGKHVAEVFVSSVTDPAQKSVFEQERTKIVRATSEACTTQAWSADARNCYMASKTPVEIKDCEKQFPAPTPKGQAVPEKNVPANMP